MTDPTALRHAADCWDRKADRLMFLESRMHEAMDAIDAAISLRLKANRLEDREHSR